MPSIKQELEAVKSELQEQLRINNHLSKLLCEKLNNESTFLKTIYSYDTINKFTNETDNLWFVTLSYDPKFVHFYDREAEYNYYESIVFKSIENDNPVIHGTYEYTKQGKLHMHFLIQTNKINEFAGKIKPLLTHRLWLNHSLEIEKPSLTKQYNNKVGVDGIYEYMSKENNIKCVYNT